MNMLKSISSTSSSSLRKQHGFTIVELLIVIVVIAVLAAITVVAFNGIQKRAEDSAISSKETQAKKALEAYKIQNNDKYPADQAVVDTLLKQTPGSKHYATYFSPSPHTHYALSVTPGSGAIADGVIMQTVTNATCPTTRTRANDARDNRSYYIQKLPDGKCWMLTNLAYAGGGTNTHGDVRSLTQATSDTSYTAAHYYVHSSANPTSGTTNPSISGNQYGYHYNWCAAMGGQSGACTASNVAPTPNQAISACPAGWRLPTGGASGQGEFADLDRAFGGTGKSASSGSNVAQWQSTGLFGGALAGVWWAGWYGQGAGGYLWSSSPHPSYSFSAFGAYFNSSAVDSDSNGDRVFGITMRCLL